MRVSTSQLQQLTIFTTVLTGAGIGTMYYLMQRKEAKMRVSTSQLQQLTIFTTVLTGAGIGTMYYLMQKKFVESDYHRLALQKLEACSVAMESLGAPPLKVHNIHLTDRNNRIDQRTAQIKIPVTGSITGGYLYTSSIRDTDTNRSSILERQQTNSRWCDRPVKTPVKTDRTVTPRHNHHHQVTLLRKAEVSAETCQGGV